VSESLTTPAAPPAPLPPERTAAGSRGSGPAAAATAIGMSERAAAKIRELVGQQGIAEGGLRVKVVGGGCSGLTYKMDLDRPREGDKVFTQDGASIIVDRKSFLYLKGTVLDWGDDLMSSGFTLQNPNVKRSCGCGSSFVV